MQYRNKIKEIVQLIKCSQKTVALTGAGISTESGIPDYRSPKTGLWEKHNPAKTASLSALRKEPALFYSTNLDRWTVYNTAKPNTAHYALTRMEKMGLLLGTITQNIDGLHVKAGAARVWEVHGHLRTCHCMECREEYPFDNLVGQFKEGDNPPRCLKCSGILRPDVVLFEDRMNEDFFKATQIISGCQLMMVIGSSLTVYPVAEFPSVAKQFVIINKTPTQWDESATVVINDSAGKVMRDIMIELGEHDFE